MAASSNFECTDVISRQLIQHLSGELSKEWKELGRYLDLSDAKLNHLEADIPNNLKERIYEMLVFWKQSNYPRATYKVLNEALRKSGRSDLIQKVDILSPGLLVGGVMIADDQLVYVFDERRNKRGVLLVCTDSRIPGKEYWRHLETADDSPFPVVMSSTGICYEDRQQVVFAVGTTLHIIRFQWSGSHSENVEDSYYQSVNKHAGSWITSIANSYVGNQPSDCCLLAVSWDSSHKFHKYRTSDFKIRKRETTGFPSLITSVAGTTELHAVIGRGHDEVILWSKDGNTVAPHLKAQVPTLKPKCVIWNGSNLIVLFIGESMDLLEELSGERKEIEWQVVSYFETGLFVKVCDKGSTRSRREIPVNITCWKNFGFTIFANNTCRIFEV